MSTFESNIKGTWILLEACRNYKNISRIIVASIDKAYGKHDKLPYVEDIVNAYLVLAEKLDDKRNKGEAFNFDTGRPVSVLNLVKEIIGVS